MSVVTDRSCPRNGAFKTGRYGLFRLLADMVYDGSVFFYYAVAESFSDR